MYFVATGTAIVCYKLTAGKRKTIFSKVTVFNHIFNLTSTMVKPKCSMFLLSTWINSDGVSWTTSTRDLEPFNESTALVQGLVTVVAGLEYMECHQPTGGIGVNHCII